jgi:hypothetical protein
MIIILVKRQSLTSRLTNGMLFYQAKRLWAAPHSATPIRLARVLSTSQRDAPTTTFHPFACIKTQLRTITALCLRNARRRG